MKIRRLQSARCADEGNGSELERESEKSKTRDRHPAHAKIRIAALSATFQRHDADFRDSSLIRGEF
jgi:hypothetical protein